MAHAISLKKKMDVNYKNEVCEAFELAKKHCLPAKMVEVKREGPIHEATFTFEITVGDFTAQGQGPSKPIAKNRAAQNILPDLRSLPLPPKEEHYSYWRERKKQKHQCLWKELPLFKPDEDPLQVINILVTNWRGKPAEYTIVDIDKESNPWIFSVQLIVAGESEVGLGKSKQEAKRNAAAKMLNSFGYNFVCIEPTPQPRERPLEVDTAPETQDLLPEEVTQTEEPPKEEESLFPQDNSTQPEEKAQLPVEEPVEVTSTEENATAQSSEDLLQFLCPDVLPMLIDMGVIEQSNDKVQWCKPSLQQETQTSGTEEVASKDVTEICGSCSPDVVMETEQIQEETEQEISLDGLMENAQNVSMDQTPNVAITDGDTLQQVVDVTQDYTYLVSQENEEEVQTTLEDLVLPSIEASTEEIVEKNEVVISELTPPTTNQEEFPDICNQIQYVLEEDQILSGICANPDAIQEDTLASLEMTSETILEETVHDIEAHGSVENDTRSDSTENQAEQPPANDQECSSECIQEATSEITTQPEVNLNVLPAEILSKLEFLGLIAKNNGIVEWSQPEPTTNCQEQTQNVCSPLETKEDMTSNVPATDEECKTPSETFQADATSLETTPESQRETSFEEGMPSLKVHDIAAPENTSDAISVIDSYTITAPEKNSEPSENNIPKRTTPPVPYRVSFFITNALVKKMFKMAGSLDGHNTVLMSVTLHNNIKQRLQFDGDGEIRLKILDKIGKKVAKHLVLEYGSADALLKVAREQDTAAFEAVVVNHLNTELRAFQNRPKSVLSRFFSRLRRAFTSQ